MSVPQAEMCWKISAKKNTTISKNEGRGKTFRFTRGKKKGRKKKEKIRDIFTAELTCCHALPWNWQEGIILLGITLFFTSPMKINPVWATYKPLKNCGLCEFTTTRDWKELPNGLNSVPCNHDKCTVDVQVQEFHRQSWHVLLQALGPKTLYYNTLLQHTENMKHEIKAIMPVWNRKKAVEAGERGGKELLI